MNNVCTGFISVVFVFAHALPVIESPPNHDFNIPSLYTVPSSNSGVVINRLPHIKFENMKLEYEYICKSYP